MSEQDSSAFDPRLLNYLEFEAERTGLEVAEISEFAVGVLATLRLHTAKSAVVIQRDADSDEDDLCFRLRAASLNRRMTRAAAYGRIVAIGPNIGVADDVVELPRRDSD